MASPAYWSPQSQPFSLVAGARSFLARRWLVALCVFLPLLALIFGSGLLRSEYDGEMKILVRRQRMDALITPQANVTPQITEGLITEEDLNSEVEVLNSEDLLRTVVLNSGLVLDVGGSDSPRNKSREVAEAVKQLSRYLTIEPIRKTDMISVHYRSHDPQAVTQVLDHLVAAYLAKHLELERPTGEAEFFEQQEQRYRTDLQQVQSQLAAFERTHGVVSASTERDFALQRMNTFTASAADAEEHVQELAQRVQTLRRKLGESSPRVVTAERSADNPQLEQQLKSTLLQLRLKRTELLTKYQPDYPLVQQADQQIAQAEAAISLETANPLRDQTTDRNPEYAWEREELTRAETELAGTRARKQSALGLARTSRRQGTQLDGLSFRQRELEDQERADQENLLLYERKAEEARVSDALDRRGILNVGLAEQPVTPALPTHGMILYPTIAVVLAALISLSLAYLFDLLRPMFSLARNEPPLGARVI